MKKTALIIIILMVFPAVTRASVQAVVDRNHISLGESINLTITMDNGKGDVDTSPIKDFQVVSQRTASNIRIINSNITKTNSSQFTLVPFRAGILKIPSLRITIDGKDFFTKKIIINVSKAPVPTGGDGSSDVWMEASVSNTSPHIGEPVIYRIKFFNKVNIANAKLIQEPSFEGFTSKRLKQNKSYKMVRNGQEISVTELDYILIPAKEGSFAIEPASISCDRVIKGQRRNSPFGSTFDNRFDSFFNNGFFGNNQLKHGVCSTKTVNIKVKALPSYRGKSKLSGLVGSFSISGKIESKTMKVGDSKTLTITIKGRGNIMDAQLPELKIPQGFKVYADNPKDDIKIGLDGYSGKKVFSMALVAVKAGKYTVPPVSLLYFDTSENKYKVVSTGKFDLTVTPSNEEKNLDALTPKNHGEHMAPSIKEKVNFTGRDILPVKDDLDALHGVRLLSPLWWAVFFIIPPMLYVFTLIIMGFTRGKSAPGPVMARRAVDTLKKADPKGPDGIFFTSLSRALVYAVYSRANSLGESLTYDEAKKILVGSKVSPETAIEVPAFLNRIDSANYGGEKMDTRAKEDMLKLTKKMIKGLL